MPAWGRPMQNTVYLAYPFASEQQEHTQGSLRTSNQEVERITIPVAGMTCAHCAQRITDALRTVPGVQNRQQFPEGPKTQ